MNIYLSCFIIIVSLQQANITYTRLHSFNILTPHRLGFRLRMSGIALDLSRFEVDFLRNLPPTERIRQEKASGEAWPMPGPSIRKSQTGFGERSR